jgi:hypothetical protein
MSSKLLALLAPECYGVVVFSDWIEMTELVKFDSAMTSKKFRNDFLDLISASGFFISSLADASTMNFSNSYLWYSKRRVSVRSIEHFLNNPMEMNDLFHYLHPKVFIGVTTLSTEHSDNSKLYVMSCGFVDAISKRCPKLEVLRLIDCKFSNMDIPPMCKIQSLQHLKHITVQGTRGDCLIGELFKNSTQVVSLKVMKGCGSLNNLFAGVARKSNMSLKVLILDNFPHMSTNISVPILRKFTNLTTFKLYKVCASTESFQILAESFSLLTDLSICRHSPPLHQASGIIWFVTSCKHLTKLNVSFSVGIDDVFLTIIATNCTKLKYLDANSCIPGFTAKGISNMLNNGCDRIKSLSLQSISPPLMSNIPIDLGIAKSKQHLICMSLAYTQFFNTDVSIILRHCSNLTELNLSNNINLNKQINNINQNKHIHEIVAECCPNLVVYDFKRCGFYLSEEWKRFLQTELKLLQKIEAVEEKDVMVIE